MIRGVAPLNSPLLTVMNVAPLNACNASFGNNFAVPLNVGKKVFPIAGVGVVSNFNLPNLLQSDKFEMDEDIEINTMSLDEINTYDQDDNESRNSDLVSNESNSGKFLSHKRRHGDHRARMMSDELEDDYESHSSHRFRSESPRQYPR